MTFLGNILSSSYKYYSRKKKHDAIFQSKLLVVYVQYIVILLLFFILHEYFNVRIFSIFIKYKILVFVLFGVIWIWTFKYYNTGHVMSNVESFNAKSLNERRIWAFITGLISIFPLILFFLIMRIRHPF
jgi:hypothetical protein